MTRTVRTVRVVPDVAAIDRRFDYEVPERFDGAVAVGARVRVPLHGRRVAAWVEAVDPPDPVDGVALRPLTGVSGLGPPPAVFDLARWAAWRWAGPLSTLLRAASPLRNVWALPPPPGSGPAAPGEGDDAVRLDGDPLVAGECRVVRLAPATDPLGMVFAALSLGRAGTLVVLVPSVGWAGRLSARLRRRGVAVASDWAQARAGWPVVVGTRSAAWAPVETLAAAVVFDAHDEAYRSGWPGFDAGEVLAERAAREGAPCALVSPCPTVVQSARRQLVVAPRDVERHGWPTVVVADRRRDDPRTGLYSESMVRVVRGALESGAPASPVVCVLNRTGRARLLACATCGELARCERCGHAMERVDEVLRCRSCGAERPVVCAACGATRLKVLRVGVSRVREELEALFKVSVAEVSGPSRRGTASSARDGGTGDHDLEAAEIGSARIVVGTEAVLHRLRRASAVVFLDFDQHLIAPRFVAAEESLALVARAARLVGGRGGLAAGVAPGTVLLQTRLPGHPVVEAVVKGDPSVVTVPEGLLRDELRLPPVTALATLTGSGAAAAAAALEGRPLIEVSDMGDGRWLVRAPDHRVLCDALASFERPAGTLRVAVDPTDL